MWWSIAAVPIFLAIAAASANSSTVPKPWAESLELTRRIDVQIRAGWQAAHITPANKAGDAEFLRRASLDLCGKIPTAWEVREFLDDEGEDRRRRLIDRLMEAPSFATFQASRWRKCLLPEADNDLNVRILGAQLEAWLRNWLLKKSSVAELATELLTAGIQNQPRPRPALLGVGQRTGISPLAYYQGKEGKPENLAANVARVFLGARIECAQCHDHPFDSWKQDQFWELAAFFGGIKRQQEAAGPIQEELGVHELKVPGTDRGVRPKLPDGTPAAIDGKQSSRIALARWITAKENKYFAKAIANRLWAQFFGVGLVDPLDDMRADNEPSHPELLELLAAELAAHDYDLRHIMRAIMLSEAYQLTSSTTDVSQRSPRMFAAARLRRLSGEQLFESLAQAVGYNGSLNRFDQAVNQPADSAAAFLEVFAETGDVATDSSTSIVQALTLMNGDFTAQATSLADSQTLAAIAEMPGISAPEEIEALYFASLSRPPQAQELEKLVAYVRGAADHRRALSDVFWALLNTAEFQSNH